MPPIDLGVREVIGLAFYTSIGLVRYMRQSWFKDVAPSKITII
jgi:hypothetical protein